MSDRRQRVAVIGASGRLGSFACRQLEASSEFELVARIGSGDDLASALRSSGATIAIESTRAGLGLEHGLACLEQGVRPLVATSGVDEEQNARLDARARELGLGGLVAPNLSLWMAHLQRAALAAAADAVRIEIVEMHHEKKRDAPSGTALDLAFRLRAARNGEDVPIHALRMPGVYARHDVVFGSAGETYTLRHEALGPEAFASGLAVALRHVARASGVARGLAAALAT